MLPFSKSKQACISHSNIQEIQHYIYFYGKSTQIGQYAMGCPGKDTGSKG